MPQTQDVLAVGRARGWFTIPETATLTGYKESSLHTMKSASRSFMRDAYRAADRRVRVPYSDVMEFIKRPAASELGYREHAHSPKMVAGVSVTKESIR